jgi:hypothetical protein
MANENADIQFVTTTTPFDFHKSYQSPTLMINATSTMAEAVVICRFRISPNLKVFFSELDQYHSNVLLKDV